MAKFVLKVGFWSNSIDFSFPTIHPSSLLNEFQDKEFEIEFIVNKLRVEMQKPSLVDFNLFVNFNFLSFFFFNASKRATVDIK